MAAKSPSLVSLCMQEVKSLLVHGDEYNDLIAAVCELPSDLFDVLVTYLPPLALHKVQEQMSLEYWNECESSDNSVNFGRKRKRIDKFDVAWKRLFRLRWPELVKKVQTDDWQRMYWETHLQNCLDEAAEIALLPSFNGSLGEIQIAEAILEYIGLEGQKNHSDCNRLKLSYHCMQFGYHAGCLRLQNVLCITEICQLLKNSKLQSLVLRCIRSKEHVDGLCKLLIQNSETLTSLEFIHCKLCSSFVNAICGSLQRKSMQTHGIQHFSVHSSNFFENNLVSLPSELVTFISSGRSLRSLKFRDSHLDSNFAGMIFSTIFDASTGISFLDLSENNISGWLSNFRLKSSIRHWSSLEKSKSLQSLKSLNLRGNNLRRDDAENLRDVLRWMPNLQFLDISENPFENDGIRSLIPYFCQASESFKLADLKLENCELSCNGVIHLLDVLSTSRRALNSLSVADNDLGSKVAAALGKFLGTSVRVLNIGGIGLGSFGFKKLQEGITEKLRLEKINISKNRGGIETAMFLLTLFSWAPELVEVNAAYNLMPLESLTILCSKLKVAKGRLKRLDLTGNNWDYQPGHASILAEFQCNGKPILILPSSSASNVPYDDDP